MKLFSEMFSLLILVTALSCNPFAPAFNDNPDTGSSVLADTREPDGVFQNIKYAYTFRDTSVYSQLLNRNFTFMYHDYDRSVDITWGRDEEMHTTYSLFQNVQRLELIWNQVATQWNDSTNTNMSISRNFNLTVTFNPSDIMNVDGYANLTLTRVHADDPWKIISWEDKSNF